MVERLHVFLFFFFVVEHAEEESVEFGRGCRCVRTLMVDKI